METMRDLCPSCEGNGGYNTCERSDKYGKRCNGCGINKWVKFANRCGSTPQYCRELSKDYEGGCCFAEWTICIDCDGRGQKQKYYKFNGNRWCRR